MLRPSFPPLSLMVPIVNGDRQPNPDCEAHRYRPPPLGPPTTPSAARGAIKRLQPTSFMLTCRCAKIGGVMKLNLLICLIFVSADPAAATSYVLKARGSVSNLTLSSGGVFSPAPAGLIALGDSFELSATFDTATANQAGVPDTNPNVSIFYFVDPVVTIKAGKYTSTLIPKSFIASSVQLWNNRLIGNRPTDAQSFEFSHYDFSGKTPFNLGGGLNAELVSSQAYDFGGQARLTDWISELSPSSNAYGSNGLTYSYSAGPNPLQGPRPAVLVSTSNVSWTLLPATVPEPATWLMLIGGFGLVGVTSRRQAKIERTSAG